MGKKDLILDDNDYGIILMPEKSLAKDWLLHLRYQMG
jgi:hypothetical protein